MTIERVAKGEEFRGLKADDWNQVADVVDRETREYHDAIGLDGFNRVSSAQKFGNNGIQQIQSPTPLPANGINEFRTTRNFFSADPSEDYDKLNSVVVSYLGDTVPGVLTPVYTEGLPKVYVNILDDLHEYAWPTAADNKEMQSGGMGYRIIWKESPGTGQKWCVLRLAHFGHTHFWGTTDAIIPDQGTGTVTVSEGTIPSGQQYTVTNDKYGEEVGAGVVVYCKHSIPDKCQIIAAACEEDTGGGGPYNPDA